MDKDYKILLQWFDFETRKLVGKEEINKTNDELATLLNLPTKYPPFVGYSYRVAYDDKKKLQSLVNHRINLRKYSYLLDSYTTKIEPYVNPNEKYFSTPEWCSLKKALEILKDREEVDLYIRDEIVIGRFFDALKENNCLKNMSS